MSVEELLRRNADRLAQQVAAVDKDALLTRISAALSGADLDADEGDAAVDDSPSGRTGTFWSAPVCLPPGDGTLPPLAEVRFHLGHALHSPHCARRAAELFELLGYEEAATICWLFAAESGDQDAADYVSEFLAPPPVDTAIDNTRRFQELARSYR